MTQRGDTFHVPQQTIESGPSVKELLLLCSHSGSARGDRALTLLLQYLENGEPFSYRHLLEAVSSPRPRIHRLPPILWRILCDWMAFTYLPGKEGKGQDAARDLLRTPPEPLFPCLLHRPISLGPWTDILPPRFFCTEPGPARAASRARWRLLRHRVRRYKCPAWGEPTFRDLAPLWKKRPSRRARPVSRGRWLCVTRSVLMVPKNEGTILPFSPSLEESYWGGYGLQTRLFLDNLVWCQAQELASIRQLAKTVSRCCRRVVLSWHNATLAAAGGWAFEVLEHMFPSHSVWKGFRKKVERRLDEAAADGEVRSLALCDLWDRRKERLLAPKIFQLLWEGRLREAAHPAWAERQTLARKLVRELLPAVTSREEQAYEKFHWSGILAPHQKDSLEEIGAAWLDAGPGWRRGLLRLSVMAEEAQHLLDRGTLDWFVLPWIDKFFISSLRERDHEYLGLLFTWLRGRGVDPLILLWEDTARTQSPSLQVALDRLVNQGYPFRGIGVFDSGGSRSPDALKIILEEHQETGLFALRPVHSESRHRSLQTLLRQPDRGFFRAYDSSWKDNLCFLYAGTQVRPLVSPQWETEPFPAWLAAQGRKFAFGEALRWRLRCEVLGEERTEPDPLGLEYSRWANLL